MKKIFLSISIFFTLLFTSCYNEVLFNVRNDVEPESASISGVIQTITRYTVNNQEYLVLIAKTTNTPINSLYTDNKDSSQIFYKPLSSNKHGDWKIYTNMPIPDQHHYDYYGSANHVGEQMILSHADSKYLYVVTAEYKNDSDEGTSNPSKYHIYSIQITLAADGSWDTTGKWTDILANNNGINYLPMYKADSFYYNAFSIFSTNSIQNSHRKVFIRSGNPDCADTSLRTVTYYELNGANAPVATSLSPVDNSKTNKINSAVYFNGGIMCFNSLASTTNETSKSDATIVYYGEGNNIKYKKITDSTFTDAGFNAGEPVSTLTVCKDALLIGRANYSSTSLSANGGIVKTSLDTNGIPGKELTAFNTNAEVQLSTNYFILSLLNTDPSNSENDSTLYSSITFFGSGTSIGVNYNNIGLWSYYPDRQNWNRE